MAETTERTGDAAAALRDRIEEATVALLGSKAEEVVLVPPRAIPKTSSGKLRRTACRTLYERGELTRARSLRWQMFQLFAGTAIPWLRRGGKRLASVAYALWFWFALALLAPVALVAAVAPPRLETRRRLVGKVIRAYARLVGVRLTVEGLDHLPAGRHVVVANHSSYLDGLVLAALLPPRYALVAKEELRHNAILRLALARLGVELVERADPAQAAADAARLERLLARGQSLAFFPEGTLRRAHGTFPFRMGAFLLAIHAGAPVVPVALRGTRTVLRGDQWFPRHGAVQATVLPPLTSQGDGWEAAVALREEARQCLSRFTGEPEVADS